MGKVKLVEDENNGKRYAMKIIRRTMIRSGPDKKFGEDVRREIAIMKKLKHDNVLDLIEVIDAKDSDKLYLIVEYYPEGTILSDLELAAGKEPRAMALPEDGTRDLVRDILKGLRYIHAQGIVHRDLKPQNILMREDGSAVIADFGISQMMNGGKMVANGGTPAFMAPEVHRGEEALATASDM